MGVQINFIAKPLKALLPLSTLKKFRGMLTRKRNIHIFTPPSISTPENRNTLKFSNNLTKVYAASAKLELLRLSRSKGFLYKQIMPPVLSTGSISGKEVP